MFSVIWSSYVRTFFERNTALGKTKYHCKNTLQAEIGKHLRSFPWHVWSLDVHTPERHTACWAILLERRSTHIVVTAGCDNHTLSRITVNKFETDPSLTFFNQNCRPSQSAVTPKCRMDNVKICKTKHLSCLASPKDVGQIREAPKISNIYLGVMFLACIENNVHKKEGKCGKN